MGLNKQNGNMYEFVTHTWNTIKGSCSHNCSYCYMKRWGKLPEIRFDKKELKTDLGKDNFIFVGSSNDMFAKDIPLEWISATIDHCDSFDNKYLFQSKNPSGFHGWLFPEKTVLGTTIETNRNYNISDAPTPQERAEAFYKIDRRTIEVMITIEPILDFDLKELVALIERVKPNWINIGADSKKGNLPEPEPNKIRELIEALSFSDIKIKKNLRRLNSL